MLWTRIRVRVVGLANFGCFHMVMAMLGDGDGEGRMLLHVNGGGRYF